MKLLKYSDKTLKDYSINFPWQDEEVYATYIAQTYYYVSHSTRLLAASAARMGNDQEILHKRFLSHADEESTHQFLALHDLKALNKDINDYPELPETSAFYESQYYKINYRDPTALLGYILVLESFAVADGSRIYKLLSDKFGKKASTFMKVHSEEDPDHVEKALKVLDHLNEKQLKLVEQNIEQTLKGFIYMLEASKNYAKTSNKTNYKKVA